MTKGMKIKDNLDDELKELIFITEIYNLKYMSFPDNRSILNDNSRNSLNDCCR
jgi:hypothetical protein